MSLYTIEFFYNGSGVFELHNKSKETLVYYYNYGGTPDNSTIAPEGVIAGTQYLSIAIVVNDLICFYYDTSIFRADGLNYAYYYYLDSNGKPKKDVSLGYPNVFTVTFSDTPSSGLSQLTVQGNNLSSVSYNNQNYTTFPADISLDSSVTTLNVNGRVGSQRIN